MTAEPMVMLTCRVPALMKAQLQRIAQSSEPSPGGDRPDVSEVQRRLLADGIRRALAAGCHPSQQPNDPPAGIPPGAPT